MAVVEVERCGGYAVVTLNRPEAMNALSRELRAALAAAIHGLQAEPEIRVLILTGAGERAFTAGLDLKELGAAGLGGGGPRDDPARAMAAFEGPIIGAINGVAITGGFELALACDVLLASENARFADTHARVGVMPGWGLSQRLSRTIGISRAKELSLTGNFLTAHRAAEWGLVNRVVPAADLMPAARQLAEDMLSVVPTMLTANKRLIDDGYALPFGEAMALEGERSGTANRSVQAQDVEGRREAIRQRGKAQKT